MLSNDESCSILPNYDDWLVIRLDLIEEYIAHSKKQKRCDPFSSRSSLVAMLLYAGRTDEALALVEESGDDSEAMMRIHVVALLKAGKIDEAKKVQASMDPNAYFANQALTWIYAAEGNLDALREQYEFFEKRGAPDVAKLHVAALMGDRELANKWAARIDARPAGYTWFANSGVVTCHCGNGFDLDVAPNFKARLQEAGASLELPKLMDWPLMR